MRSRLLLGGIAAGLAMSFVPQASAEPVNCHHMPWLCQAVDDATSSINCHHIGWLCQTIDELIGTGGR